MLRRSLILQKTFTVSLLTSLLVLSACGFRPLHSQSSDVNLSHYLSSIEVESIADRSGQILRNDLQTRLSPRGPSSNTTFTLTTSLNESIQHLAIQKNAFAVRANLQLEVTYNLIRKSDKTVLLTSRNTVVTSYNITSSDYATLIAQKDARERALKEIADAMHTQLSVFIVKFSNTPADE